MAPEPEGSSPYSQGPATGPCSEPTGSNLHSPANLPKIHSDTILPSTPWSSKWSLSFWLSHQNPEHIPLLSVASMKNTIFWDIAPCSLVQVDQRFRCSSCPQYQGGRVTSETSAKFYQTTWCNIHLQGNERREI
jgi:hypothetical protein